MEPRERLKRYLEQRRELGERELVLDGMTVEDVMRIVGAMGGGGAPVPSRKDAPGVPATPVPAESGGSSEEVAAKTVAPTADLRPKRDDPPATTDWREALRASGVESASAEGKARKPAMQASAPKSSAPQSPAPPSPAPPITAGAGASEKPVSKRYEFPRPDDAPSAPSAGSAVAPADPTLPTGPASKRTTAPASEAPPPVAAPPGLVVGTPVRDLFVGDSAPPSLEQIAEATRVCTRCRLYATATNAVPGEGSPNAELVCVGEAPGANEDATGRPFVGQAGQLLTKILAAINLGREDVFICNVLKHRPPGNRNPLPDEVAACSPYLVQQLEVIRPKVIVAFGTFAAQTLLNTKLPIGKLRGSVHRYYGIPLIVTYHPAALLRNPAWKRPTWEDVQLARRILDSAPRT